MIYNGMKFIMEGFAVILQFGIIYNNNNALSKAYNNFQKHTEKIERGILVIDTSKAVTCYVKRDINSYLA